MNDTMLIALICLPWISTIVLFGLWKREVKSLEKEIRSKIASHIQTSKLLDEKTDDCMRLGKLYKDTKEINRKLHADIQQVRHIVDAKGSF